MTPEPDAVEQGVIAAYRDGLSYQEVSRGTGISTTRISAIMNRFAPESIRQFQQKFTPIQKWISLSNLGLFSVGPCKICKVPMVSETREREQTCGLCQAAAQGAIAR